MDTKRYVVLDKQVGETPLSCMEAWRSSSPGLELTGVPLTYAGRLDPMASGKLLVLIGEECKRKDVYLNLDKEYEFQVLFGISSDSGDVLGLLTTQSSRPGLELRVDKIKKICRSLTGQITLPYPHYSSKTVHGKPLHTWTTENRLDEIEIPTKKSVIYKLTTTALTTKTGSEIYQEVSKKIETIPPVTELRKAMGNDFRREGIRTAWKQFHESHANDTFSIATFRTVCSSGTYMRSLAEVIATELNTTGLAYSIDRTEIGRYQPLPFNYGVWKKTY